MSSPPIGHRAGVAVIPAGLVQMNSGINPQDPRYQAILEKVKLGQQLEIDDLESAQQLIDWQQKRIEKLQGDINSYEESLEGMAEEAMKKSASCEELQESYDELKSSYDDLHERSKKLEGVPDRLERVENKYKEMKKEKEKLDKNQTKLIANLQLAQQRNQQLTDQVAQLNTGGCPSSIKEGIVKTIKYLGLDCILPVNNAVAIEPEDIEELKVKKNPLAQD